MNHVYSLTPSYSPVTETCLRCGAIVRRYPGGQTAKPSRKCMNTLEKEQERKRLGKWLDEQVHFMEIANENNS